MRPILLPERLQSVREKMGISKAEAARRLGLTAPAYFYYESGERIPARPIIERMAQEFHTSSSFLMGKVDDMNPDCIVIRDAKLVRFLTLLQNDSGELDEPLKDRLYDYLDDLIRYKLTEPAI